RLLAPASSARQGCWDRSSLGGLLDCGTDRTPSACLSGGEAPVAQRGSPPATGGGGGVVGATDGGALVAAAGCCAGASCTRASIGVVPPRTGRWTVSGSPGAGAAEPLTAAGTANAMAPAARPVTATPVPSHILRWWRSPCGASVWPGAASGRSSDTNCPSGVTERPAGGAGRSVSCG